MIILLPDASWVTPGYDHNARRWALCMVSSALLWISRRASNFAPSLLRHHHFPIDGTAEILPKRDRFGPEKRYCCAAAGHRQTAAPHASTTRAAVCSARALSTAGRISSRPSATCCRFALCPQQQYPRFHRTKWHVGVGYGSASRTFYIMQRGLAFIRIVIAPDQPSVRGLYARMEDWFAGAASPSASASLPFSAGGRLAVSSA